MRLLFYAQGRVRKFAARAARAPRGEQGKVFPARLCILDERLSAVLEEMTKVQDL